MLAGMAILANCEASTRAKTNGSGSARAREIVITTVPLLTKELATTYPFLKKDFATGGVLAGKEVYEFMPSTITVVEGDTLRLTFINPEDDAHSFVMEGLSVAIPGQSETHATYVAAHAGIYDFVCAIPAHLPMMRGQVVVLRQESSAH
jgi:plastocyanin